MDSIRFHMTSSQFLTQSGSHLILRLYIKLDNLRLLKIRQLRANNHVGCHLNKDLVDTLKSKLLI